MRYAVASVLLFTGFVILTALLSNNSVIHWDSNTFQKINDSHGNIVDGIMFTFSAYGREVVWTGIVIILFVFGKSEGRKTAILLVVTFLILIPAGIILKDEIHRPRPVPQFDKLLLKTDHDDPSFPSGHALITSAGACILLTQYFAGKRKIISLILLAEAAIVSFSLVYVGAHYPLDVVGGILLGLATSFAVVTTKGYLEPIFRFVNSIGIKKHK